MIQVLLVRKQHLLYTARSVSVQSARTTRPVHQTDGEEGEFGSTLPNTFPRDPVVPSQVR